MSFSAFPPPIPLALTPPGLPISSGGVTLQPYVPPALVDHKAKDTAAKDDPKIATDAKIAKLGNFLLIEDSLVAIDTFTAIYAKDYNIVVVKNGADALLQSELMKFDLIFCDQNLESKRIDDTEVNILGTGVVFAIRSNEANPNHKTKIIGISADKENGPLMLAAGATEAHTKLPGMSPKVVKRVLDLQPALSPTSS